MRTKSKERPNHHKPTIEETTELLRTTIIPVVIFQEDQLVTERVALINKLFQEAGIEPHRLRVLVPATDRARQMRTGGLKIRNVPAAVVLKYLCDNTILRYRVCENGVVELFSQSSQADELNYSLPKTEKREHQSENTDIFGNAPDTPDEPDPFAIENASE